MAILGILIFLLGAAFGSFLSVLVNRTLKGEPGILTGKSKCPHCNTPLKSQDLIPLLSFAFNLGKCRYCSKSISAEYPLLELTTGTLFLANFFWISADILTPFFWLQFSYLSLISLLLIAISFSDIKCKEIPNSFLIALVVAAFFGPFILGGLSLSSVLLAIAIALIFFGGQWVISKGRFLGSGDIFIAVSMALLLGIEKLLVGIVFAYLIGSLISIILLATRTLTRKDSIPFGPFLSIATLIALYFGDAIINWYINASFINFIS